MRDRNLDRRVPVGDQLTAFQTGGGDRAHLDGNAVIGVVRGQIGTVDNRAVGENLS